AGDERLARRCGELERVGVARGSTGDADREVSGVARNADRRVRGVEESLRAAADVVARVAEHRDAGWTSRGAGEARRETAHNQRTGEHARKHPPRHTPPRTLHERALPKNMA